MPNSPMPMLDICDWLLLMIVLTTGGGHTGACFFSWLSLLVPPEGLLAGSPWMLPMTIFSVCLGAMVVGVEELCCVLIFCEVCVFVWQKIGFELLCSSMFVCNCT
jgi:hypothetical protein